MCITQMNVRMHTLHSLLCEAIKCVDSPLEDGNHSNDCFYSFVHYLDEEAFLIIPLWPLFLKKITCYGEILETELMSPCAQMLYYLNN